MYLNKDYIDTTTMNTNRWDKILCISISYANNKCEKETESYPLQQTKYIKIKWYDIKECW